MKPRLVAAAAALSAACFVSVFLTPVAGAEDAALTVYGATGIGQGVITSFAIRPSIFDPLLQAGGLYGANTLTSAGGGGAYAMASQLFPGSFAVGAVGCGGLPGGQWVQAFYPAPRGCTERQDASLKESQHSTFGAEQGHPELDVLSNTVADHLAFKTGRVHAGTGLGAGEAEVLVNDYELRGDPLTASVLAAKQLRVHTKGERIEGHVSQTVEVHAHDVSLLGGALLIDSIISRAQATSDGTASTAATSFTIKGVVALVGDTYHRATIDATGVTIDDPALSHKANGRLDEAFDETMLKAGLRITVAKPTELTDGGHADAAVGGLILAVSGTIPSVAVPQQLAPVVGAVIKNIPTTCLYEVEPPQAPSLPLCFGAGVLPGGGSEIKLTLSVASAESIVDAATVPAFDGGVPSVGTGNGASDLGGTQVLGDQFTSGGDQGSFPDAGSQSTTTTFPGLPVAPAVLLGLVARMPSAALAIGGVGFLILAIGIALAPSLRHAGTR